MSRIGMYSKRLDEARANGEPVEVIYELAMDMANAIETELGDPRVAAEARATARTLLPMFGMQAERDRAQQPWWRRKRWQPPDYRTRADLYRSDLPFHAVGGVS